VECARPHAARNRGQLAQSGQPDGGGAAGLKPRAKDTKSCGLGQRLCQSAKVQTGPGFAQAQQSRDDDGGVGDWHSLDNQTEEVLRG